MRRHTATILRMILLLAPAISLASEGGPQITIYNQDFALVKERRSFTLQEGMNEVRLTKVTALLEPDSIILRDREDPDGLRIQEQNYEGDPLSEGFLLRQHEGKVVRFQRVNPATGAIEIVHGRVIRSGYVPPRGGWRLSGVRQSFAPTTGDSSPIVEVDGSIQFFLPGRPLFDALAEDAILEPTLLWKLWTDRSGAHDVELSYLTGGLRWEATYNLVAPERGDRFDLVGWVTLENRSGTEFEGARIKLMAGDVSKLQPGVPKGARDFMVRAEAAPPPAVTERPFDEYHLYTLRQLTTLRNRETKQVEFCRGIDVPGRRLYTYDGARLQEYGGRVPESVRLNATYGAESHNKVAVTIEFENITEAGLGFPLPMGTIKVYRTDADGGREFIGENAIDHTPANETVRLLLGNAFDLVGERRQIDFQVDHDRRVADESFEIRLRNHKDEPVEIRAVEHLYRWAGWEIRNASDAYTKVDSRTVEFKVQVPPDGEKVITYEVHYTW